MINTISLDEAVSICPAINATQPAPRASSKYTFISTRKILDQALENDWLIRSVKSSRNKSFGCHSISLIHKSQDLNEDSEGFPNLNIINSHDLSRRFTFALGFYRLICSNGLIAPTGLHNHTSVLHRSNYTSSPTEEFNTAILSALDDFSSITSNVKQMKERFLTEEEKISLSRFAHYIRFRYRMVQPRKADPQALLQARRENDKKNDLWTVFNTIQENITLGGSNIGKGITQFQDDIRFNREMWTGANLALQFSNASFEDGLKNLFPKKPRKQNLN